MQLQSLLPAFLAALISMSSIVQATPVACPESTIDQILNGQLSPDVCCNYGICKGDILVKPVKARK